jgi:hypothetical protein
MQFTHIWRPQAQIWGLAPSLTPTRKHTHIMCHFISSAAVAKEDVYSPLASVRRFNIFGSNG